MHPNPFVKHIAGAWLQEHGTARPAFFLIWPPTLRRECWTHSQPRDACHKGMRGSKWQGSFPMWVNQQLMMATRLFTRYSCSKLFAPWTKEFLKFKDFESQSMDFFKGMQHQDDLCWGATMPAMSKIAGAATGTAALMAASAFVAPGSQGTRWGGNKNVGLRLCGCLRQG